MLLTTEKGKGFLPLVFYPSILLARTEKCLGESSKVGQKLELVQGTPLGEFDTGTRMFSGCGDEELFSMELVPDLEDGMGDNWGDFNIICYSSERSGDTHFSSAILEFSEFIFEQGLMDIPLVGENFTWSNNCDSST